MAKTLEELREIIDNEVPFVDIKPYSHNIIGLALVTIAKRYGYDVANQAIEDFGLEDLGWHKVKGR